MRQPCRPICFMNDFILFCLCHFYYSVSVFTNASHLMGNDVENPLITDSEYAPLANNDNDDDANNLPVAENRAWTVPRGQFDVGIPIYGTIFGFATSMNQDNPISLMIRYHLHHVIYRLRSSILWILHFGAKGWGQIAWHPACLNLNTIELISGIIGMTCRLEDGYRDLFLDYKLSVYFLMKRMFIWRRRHISRIDQL